MKRFLVLALVFGAIFGSALGVSVLAHADSTPMTEAHIARIRSNCVEAQSSLSRLHATDALLRVNMGQLYESILTKLMSPFNSRVALNNLDGATLVSLANTYNQQLTDFRTNYQQYEEAMSRTLKIDCANQPVTFYDSVTDTRDKRKTVNDSTTALQTTIQTYKTEFESFATKFSGDAK